MSSSKPSSRGPTRSPWNAAPDDSDSLFSSSSDGRAAPSSSINFDSIFGGSSGSGAKATSSPVYDKPVYDDDIFDGVPGLKTSGSVNYDAFSTVSGSKQKQNDAFDDLLGGFGRKDPEPKRSGNVEDVGSGFDDLLHGFGRISPPSNRPTTDINWAPKSTVNATETTSNVIEDPFVVLESTSTPAVSSSVLFSDPLEEISKLSNSGSTRVDGSSAVGGGAFNDLDPLDGLGKSAFPSEMNKRGKNRSPSSTEPTSETQTFATKEPIEKSSVEGQDSHSQKKMPAENYWESHQTLFDIPTVSTDSHKSFSQTPSPPSHVNASPNETNSQGEMSPRSEENLSSSDDVWLTVSDIPLFTQPTSAPPPSRPPPTRPTQVSRAETGSFGSNNARKKVNEFSSFTNSSQYSQSPKLTRGTVKSSAVSQIDELEDFAMGRTQNNVDGHAEGLYGDEFETNSVAAASAAAMKEAMDRAEAKFRHAKGVRERESAKASRSKEAGQLDRDEKAMQDAQERAIREKQERLEHERQEREREEEEREQRRLERTREIEREREEKEREQRRLEKERERAREIEREREKARQAVERATKEARERAAAEARLKAERAAVGKVNAEARERAERAAVHRAQAEARERAAAEAKERAEKAAAEARERANTEAREKEARERAAVARAEAEVRLRTERAAVERAAAEARERAAAAARVNQQKNENDLESFFSMGSRPSSAPRPRANSSDPVFDTQFQNRRGPEVARTAASASSSMRKASSTTNIVDDLSSIFGAAPSSGDFQDVEGESEDRRRARLERHQRTQERAAKALAEKNQRDLQAQRDQAERHRIAETLDVEIKRWSAGKEGNLRALLSTLQYVLWPECGWQPVSLTDLITAASVKKVYRKATLCIHPDKVQQKGANLQQKYIAEKVFDLLKEAWNKFNSEELF